MMGGRGRARKDIVLESKGHCCFCLEKIPTVKVEAGGEVAAVAQQVPRYGLAQLSRYLKMDLGKVFGAMAMARTPAEVGSRLKAELCLECASINGKISALYGQLEKLEMEMGTCLKIIEQKMETADATEKIDELRGLINAEDQSSSDIKAITGWTKMKLVDVFRVEALKKCQEKLGADRPRVKVRKVAMTTAQQKNTTTVLTLANELATASTSTATASQNREEFDGGDMEMGHAAMEGVASNEVLTVSVDSVSIVPATDNRGCSARILRPSKKASSVAKTNVSPALSPVPSLPKVVKDIKLAPLKTKKKTALGKGKAKALPKASLSSRNAGTLAPPPPPGSRGKYKFCVCKKFLEGEKLIQCENEGCQFGSWFHFENDPPCVTFQGESEWYCVMCLPNVIRNSSWKFKK